MDWVAAVKIGGASVLAAFTFSTLITNYLEKAELIKSSLLLNIILVVTIFVFCSFMGWLWLRPRNPQAKPSVVLDNEINENKVDGAMKVGVGQIIESNKITKNEVKGDFVIGGKE